jgi:hypothetical protein
MLRDEIHGILYLHRELSQKKVPNTRGKLPWLPNVMIASNPIEGWRNVTAGQVVFEMNGNRQPPRRMYVCQCPLKDLPREKRELQHVPQKCDPRRVLQ